MQRKLAVDVFYFQFLCHANACFFDFLFVNPEHNFEIAGERRRARRQRSNAAFDVPRKWEQISS